MNDGTARFAFVVACTVAPLAVIGSAVSLYGIAQTAGLAFPLALPVATDLTALAAAAQIRAGRHRVLAWVTLVAGVLGSAALQVADAWARGPSAWGVHASLPLAALVAFELAMPTKNDRATPASAPEPEPTVAPPPPAPGPAPVEVPPVPLPKQPARKRPVRPAATVDQLAKRAERVAAKLRVPVTDLSQRQLMAELKIGTARARELAEHLAERRPLELVASTNGAEP